MNKSGVYLIKNTQNGKIYIGSAVNIKRRWGIHRSTLKGDYHDNEHLQRAWNKYGKDAFEFQILLYCNKDDLIMWEQRIIDKFKEDIGWEHIYNITPTAGSCLGCKRSPEYRAKMSVAKRGMTLSTEHRAKLSAALKGRVFSPETRAKMAKAHKNPSPETRTKMSESHKGKIFSSETRAKMSEARRGKTRLPFSPEHKAKISAAKKGRKRPPFSSETRAKMSVAAKNRSPETKTKPLEVVI